MYSKNVFKYKYLHPKYALTWLGVGVLYLLVQLPYTWIVMIGGSLGNLSRLILKRRAKIVKRNLQLCFPDKSVSEIEQMVKKNFYSLGIALFETGMAWFWSDRRITKIFTITGGENFTNAMNKQRGIMVVGVHFMSIELGGRIMGTCYPINAMYRPHNNKVMEYIQTKGRTRSNKGMIDRRNLKFMIEELKSGKAIWFAPDQDLGTKGTLFAPFFTVKNTSTSKGTAMIAQLSNSVVLTMVLIRNNKNGKPYEMIIGPELDNYPTGDKQYDAEYINHIIENEIMRAPEQYLWAHRRFKTRPKGEPTFYENK